MGDSATGAECVSLWRPQAADSVDPCKANMREKDKKMVEEEGWKVVNEERSCSPSDDYPAGPVGERGDVSLQPLAGYQGDRGRRGRAWGYLQLHKEK